MYKKEKYYKDTGKMNSELMKGELSRQESLRLSYQSNSTVIKVADFTLEFVHGPQANLTIIAEDGFKYELGTFSWIDGICTESLYIALQIRNRACSSTAATKPYSYILAFNSKEEMVSFINRVLVSGMML